MGLKKKTSFKWWKCERYKWSSNCITRLDGLINGFTGSKIYFCIIVPCHTTKYSTWNRNLYSEALSHVRSFFIYLVGGRCTIVIHLILLTTSPQKVQAVTCHGKTPKDWQRPIYPYQLWGRNRKGSEKWVVYKSPGSLPLKIRLLPRQKEAGSSASFSRGELLIFGEIFFLRKNKPTTILCPMEDRKSSHQSSTKTILC